MSSSSRSASNNTATNSSSGAVDAFGIEIDVTTPPPLSQLPPHIAIGTSRSSSLNFNALVGGVDDDHNDDDGDSDEDDAADDAEAAREAAQRCIEAAATLAAAQKSFDTFDLQQHFGASIVKRANKTELSPPSCSTSANTDEQRASTSCAYTRTESELSVKPAAIVFYPPISNPVDLAIEGDTIGIAGIQWLRTETNGVIPSTSIAASSSLPVERDNESSLLRVVLLAYRDERWSCRLHSWPALREELAIDCPLQPAVPSWARRKICIVGSRLFLLATSEQRTAIFTLQLPSTSWKTLAVENGRSNKLGLTLANTLLIGGSNAGGSTSNVYSDIDVARWSSIETRIVLCEAQKSQLNIFILTEPAQLIDRQTIKVKRRKAQRWIIQGPKLAVYDTNRDIVVCDASGKLFWFDGVTFRLQKIIGDIGRSEVCAIEAQNGWLYVLCRHPLCVHAFCYKSD